MQPLTGMVAQSVLPSNLHVKMPENIFKILEMGKNPTRNKKKSREFKKYSDILRWNHLSQPIKTILWLLINDFSRKSAKANAGAAGSSTAKKVTYGGNNEYGQVLGSNGKLEMNKNAYIVKSESSVIIKG